jgi:peptidoglycan L-alanyl-D-glutamate endopeptidase CwlK
MIQRLVKDAAEDFPMMVICGHRTEAEQSVACRTGKSKAPWPTSRHNSLPSEAVDLAPLKNGTIDWNDTALFRDLANHVLAVAKARGVSIRWGGDWDGDGLTRGDGDKDERFVDLPHFELMRG